MKVSKARLLVVDDDPEILELLEAYFKPRGYQLTTFSECLAPLRVLENSPAEFDLVISDLKMPEMDGIEFVRRVKKISPRMPIIQITAHRSVEAAVEAIQAGAFDFVVKPLNCGQLNASIERALRMRTLETDNEVLRREVRSTKWSFEGAIGKSEAIRAVFDLAKRVAKSRANVLVTGESGVGKEVIARAIHFHGGREQAPFVAINCSAIPDNLLESELFGHAKGAFTGAIDKKLGLFEEAEGGVLFLDEIGDMNLALQAKLLRVLQERKIKRLGENQYRPINVRIIAATHRDLKAEIVAKTFREDLYYRLCVIPIRIPPLRERVSDILPLAAHFLEKFRAENDSSVTGFTKVALDRLVRLKWRGNVRELENVIERAVVLCQNERIDIGDLPELDGEFTAAAATPEAIASSSPAAPADSKDSEEAIRMAEVEQAEALVDHETVPVVAETVDRLFHEIVDAEALPSLEEFSQRYVAHVLKAADGVRERAANILKIDRKTLYRRTRELDDSVQH